MAISHKRGNLVKDAHALLAMLGSSEWMRAGRNEGVQQQQVSSFLASHPVDLRIARKSAIAQHLIQTGIADQHRRKICHVDETDSQIESIPRGFGSNFNLWSEND